MITTSATITTDGQTWTITSTYEPGNPFLTKPTTTAERDGVRYHINIQYQQATPPTHTATCAVSAPRPPMALRPPCTCHGVPEEVFTAAVDVLKQCQTAMRAADAARETASRAAEPASRILVTRSSRGYLRWDWINRRPTNEIVTPAANPAERFEHLADSNDDHIAIYSILAA